MWRELYRATARPAPRLEAESGWRHQYTDWVSLIIGLITLPFFLWSWIKHDVDEDAAAAVSIMAWIVLSLSGTAILYFVFR